MIPLVIDVLVALVLAGLVIWVVNQFPQLAPATTVIRVVVIVLLTLYLLSLVTGYGGPLPRWR